MKTNLKFISVKLSQSSIAKNSALAVAQILLWGASFFILSVLAGPIMIEMKWSHAMVYGVLSISLLVSGLVSSKIGNLINKNEKDYILSYSGFVMALGLTVIGLAHNFIIFVLGWLIIGIAMGMGLYDALFALLGKKYGSNASKSIIQITLISGFAPTISWFVISYFLGFVDWRTICFVYALLLVLLVFPLHYFALKTANVVTTKYKEDIKIDVKTNYFNNKIFRLLLVYFTIGSILMTGIVVHLIDILLSKQIPLATAVGLAALLGPSQVGVRVIDLILPKKSPEKTAIISAVAILLGLIVLLISFKIAFLGVIIFGLGNGMRSILKGTLPLTFFEQKEYALVMGKLAGLPLIAQAATPFIGGFILQQFGSTAFLIGLGVLAFVNIMLVFILNKLSK